MQRLCSCRKERRKRSLLSRSQFSRFVSKHYPRIFLDQRLKSIFNEELICKMK